jgi:hypothetical protein
METGYNLISGRDIDPDQCASGFARSSCDQLVELAAWGEKRKVIWDN